MRREEKKDDGRKGKTEDSSLQVSLFLNCIQTVL